MGSSVLVLNQDFSPLSICSVYRAFILVFLSKADLVNAYEDEPFRTIDETYPKPSVIRIKNYVSVPYKGVTFTRQHIFRRDNHTCQYCGATADLTLDHVIPKAKGGKSTWRNLVAACDSCNAQKGSMSLGDIDMTLAREPFKPSPFLFLADRNGRVRDEWKDYFRVKG